MIRRILLTGAVLAAATSCAGQDHATPPPTSTPAPSSTGIDPQQAAKVEPLAPGHLDAVLEAGTLRLSWPATGEDVDYYRCLRRKAGATQWETIGRTAHAELTLAVSNPGTTADVYGVQAVNAYGTASSIVESRPTGSK